MANQWIPNVLVLGVGGLVGEAWMSGFLAGMEEQVGFDACRADAFVGTSAGSIVAAALMAGVSPRRPDVVEAHQTHRARARPLGATLRRVRRASLSAAYPLASMADDVTAPAMAVARAAVLASLPTGSRSLDRLRSYISELGCEFDGRLRVVAVDRATGKRVVFGAPSAPAASVVDAVSASCAVPSVFPPVPIGGRDYVDGGIWSPSNLDAAPIETGDRVLCLLPTGAMSRSRQTVVRGLGTAFHSRTALEIAGARRRGATVRAVVPDAGAARAMGQDPFDASRAPRVVAEGFRQGGELSRWR
jgi:NTE family protein